jgi:hypothetical protein
MSSVTADLSELGIQIAVGVVLRVTGYGTVWGPRPTCLKLAIRSVCHKPIGHRDGSVTRHAATSPCTLQQVRRR